MDEPMFRAWVQDSLDPESYYDERPGSWVAETQWPSPDLQTHEYFLGDGTLEESADFEAELDFRGSQFNGSGAGLWCPYGEEIDFPIDQRTEDGLSLSFTSSPMSEDVVLLGNPQVSLKLASDQPNALVVVRLCDVAPTGESLLISRGFLNLTHRDSHEEPTPLQPGKLNQVTIPMDVAGHRLPVGHRWRLSISPTYWPMAWPSPHVVNLKIKTGGDSWLHLPIRKPKDIDNTLTGFESPVESEPIPYKKIRPGRRARTITHDIGGKKQEIFDLADTGHIHLLDRDLEMYGKSEERFTVYEDEPLSANIESEQELGLRRGDWDIRIETYSAMSADTEQFFVINKLDAYEGKIRVFTKTWNTTVPRRMV
jgi:hypothetical protein